MKRMWRKLNRDSSKYKSLLVVLLSRWWRSWDEFVKFASMIETLDQTFKTMVELPTFFYKIGLDDCYPPRVKVDATERMLMCFGVFNFKNALDFEICSSRSLLYIITELRSLLLLNVHNRTVSIRIVRREFKIFARRTM